MAAVGQKQHSADNKETAAGAVLVSQEAMKSAPAPGNEGSRRQAAMKAAGGRQQ